MRKKNSRASKIFDLLSAKELLILPGNLAYYFVLSIVPVITLILYIATQFNLSIEVITNFIEANFSKEVLDLITPILEESGFSLSMLIYLIIAFFLASNGSNSIIVASNTVFNIDDSTFIHRRVKAFVLTFLIIILFTFILIVPLFGKEILNLLSIVGIDNSLLDGLKIIYPVLNIPISIIVIFFFVKLLYTIAPDENIPSKYVNKGAIFTTIFWIIITAGYSYYIKHYALYGRFYAGLSNIVILMLWFYLLAYIFVIGIVLNYKDSLVNTEKTNTIKLKEIQNKIRESKSQ